MVIMITTLQTICRRSSRMLVLRYWISICNPTATVFKIIQTSIPSIIQLEAVTQPKARNSSTKRNLTREALSLSRLRRFPRGQELEAHPPPISRDSALWAVILVAHRELLASMLTPSGRTSWIQGVEHSRTPARAPPSRAKNKSQPQKSRRSVLLTWPTRTIAAACTEGQATCPNTKVKCNSKTQGCLISSKRTIPAAEVAKISLLENRALTSQWTQRQIWE